jgi:hypothetical protein
MKRNAADGLFTKPSRFVICDARLSLMNDERRKRRNVDAISHLFLSCQDENNETTARTHRAAPPDSARLPAGIRIVTSDPDGHEISPAMSQAQEGEFRSAEPRVFAAGPLGHPAEQGEGLESGGPIQLVIDPHLYPVAKLGWAEAPSRDGGFDATIPLRKEVWLDVVKYCRQRVEQADRALPRALANTLNRVADLIMSEITAEEKRERNREAYASFADFVAAISARTDIDKARRAQIIHERACRLKVE